MPKERGNPPLQFQRSQHQRNADARNTLNYLLASHHAREQARVVQQLNQGNTNQGGGRRLRANAMRFEDTQRHNPDRYRRGGGGGGVGGAGGIGFIA